MATLREAAQDFLSCKRIAVAGVSRQPGMTANALYRRLQTSGVQAFPVNPKAAEVEGVPCYPNLESIPGGVDAVLVVTPPEAAEELVRECLKLGIRRVWMHRAFGQGSVAGPAVNLGRENGITVIDGACPMMFLEPVDIFHRCFRWLLGWTGKLPQGV